MTEKYFLLHTQMTYSFLAKSDKIVSNHSHHHWLRHEPQIFNKDMKGVTSDEKKCTDPETFLADI